MKTAIDSSQATLSASPDKLATDIAAVAAEAAELFKDAGGRGMRRTLDALATAQGAVRAGSTDALDATGQYVRDNPLKALLAAAGAGALLAMLLSSRR